MSDRHIDAAAALDRLFSVVRQEAQDNPKFAARLLAALDVQVLFRGAEAADSVDPLQVALQGPDEFRKTFLSFTPAQLKTMIKEFNLATPADLRGKSKGPQLVEVMWAGALSKIRDRGLAG